MSRNCWKLRFFFSFFLTARCNLRSLYLLLIVFDFWKCYNIGQKSKTIFDFQLCCWKLLNRSICIKFLWWTNYELKIHQNVYLKNQKCKFQCYSVSLNARYIEKMWFPHVTIWSANQITFKKCKSICFPFIWIYLNT